MHAAGIYIATTCTMKCQWSLLLSLATALTLHSGLGHLEVNPLSALKHQNVKVKIGKLVTN